MVSSSSRALAPGFFVGSDAPSWATTEEDARTESDGDGRWMTGRADQRASAGGDHLAAQCCAAAHALILARFMPLRVLRVLTRSGNWRGLKKCVLQLGNL